ncbi:hypothetical protein ABFS82_04G091100 [Erythranthe guttata]|nr:PREDICTED: dnaJ homolog subfamily B member 6-like isoform X1 [Erythranthe guttata]|eukprot:XP_012849825.1 PREDICTED: dnaJ homolog subfamily B member 6-like isoform X1 [Erythranthe guttata]
MAADEEKSSDFYGVLGLRKECTAAELRVAYKKLAMKWHPDRCSASGNLKYVEEAKNKFQAVQQAYSVLSDANKRFLYDVGIYDSEDDADENGMGDFLNEMVAMMGQSKPNENKNESFQELQDLFEEIFNNDAEEVFKIPPPHFPYQDSCSETRTASNKRNAREMGSVNFSNIEATPFEGFCIGENVIFGGERIQTRPGGGSRRTKPKISTSIDGLIS